MKKLLALVLASLVVAGCAESDATQTVPSPSVSTQGAENTESLANDRDELNWPVENQECSATNFVVGRSASDAFVWLSCGPDGLWHPQNGEPEVEIGPDGLPSNMALWPSSPSKETSDSSQKDAADTKEKSAAAEISSLGSKLKDSQLSLENLTEYDIPKIALAEVSTLVDSGFKGTNAPELVFHVGPTVTPEELANAEALFRAAALGWSDYYAPDRVHMVVYTLLDAEWGDEMCWELEKRECEFVAESKRNFGGHLGSGASTVWPHSKDSDAIVYLAINRYQGDEVLGAIAAHELWHNLQNQYLSGPMTMWYHEGTPAYFGSATQGEIYGERWDMIRQPGNGSFDPWNEGEDFSRWYRVASNMTPEVSVELFTRLDGIHSNPECSDNSGPIDCRGQLGHYHLGAMATEALVAVYGIEKFMEFVVGMKSQGWEASFKQKFEVAPIDFYELLAPYIRARVDY